MKCISPGTRDWDHGGVMASVLQKGGWSAFFQALQALDDCK